MQSWHWTGGQLPTLPGVRAPRKHPAEGELFPLVNHAAGAALPTRAAPARTRVEQRDFYLETSGGKFSFPKLALEAETIELICVLQAPA